MTDPQTPPAPEPASPSTTTVPEPSSPSDLPLHRRLLNLVRFGKAPESTADLEQEIQELVDDGEEQGLITPQEGMMINSILELRDTEARAIMTPRSDMVAAPATATVPEIIALITAKGFTRIPVYAENPDQVIGFIHAKNLLNFCSAANPPLAGEIVNPILVVLETHNIVELLREFKSRQIHMAIVTDEFGSVRGLVTLEDVIEEIVGEINDEYDRSNVRWRVQEDGSVLTDAKVNIELVEEHFGLEMPDVSYESVGGLIIDQLGRVPEAGTVLEIPPQRLTVVAANARKVSAVRIQRILPPPAEE